MRATVPCVTLLLDLTLTLGHLTNNIRHNDTTLATGRLSYAIVSPVTTLLQGPSVATWECEEEKILSPSLELATLEFYLSFKL